MNEDKAVEFVSRYTRDNTVAIMLISKHGNEFRSVLMQEDVPGFHLGARRGVDSVIDYLDEFPWKRKTTPVPEGINGSELHKWMAENYK